MGFNLAFEGLNTVDMTSKNLFRYADISEVGTLKCDLYSTFYLANTREVNGLIYLFRVRVLLCLCKTEKMKPKAFEIKLDSLSLKMHPLRTFETSVSTYQSVQAV
jgi:hypothetical protein